MSGPLDVLRDAIDELDVFYVDQADYIAQARAALAAVEQLEKAARYMDFVLKVGKDEQLTRIEWMRIRRAAGDLRAALARLDSGATEGDA